MVYNFVDIARMLFQSLAYQSLPFLSIVKDLTGRKGVRVAGKTYSAPLTE